MSKVKVGQLVFIADQNLYPGKSEELLYELHVITQTDTTDTVVTPRIKWERPDDTDNLNILYKLLHNEFLDNSYNSYSVSFLDILEYYKNANLDNLLNYFDDFTQKNEFFYEKLKEIDNIIDLASTGSITTENNNYADEDQYQALLGIGITLEEYYQIKNFVSMYIQSLHIIKQSIRIYKKFLVFQETNTKYEEAHNILHNDSSLNDFVVDSMKSKTVDNLNVKTKLNIRPKLDPYIKKYVSIHGWPADGVFDNELMSNIIINENSLFNYLPPWNCFPPPF